MVWKPGESGNPKGAARNTRQHRDKLATHFLRAMASSFEEKGVAAIDEVIKNSPAEYLRVIASIIPKELEVTNRIGELTDEQLADVVTALRSAISAGLVREAASAEGSAEQAQGLPPIH